jgi:hypothetical protein
MKARSTSCATDYDFQILDRRIKRTQVSLNARLVKRVFRGAHHDLLNLLGEERTMRSDRNGLNEAKTAFMLSARPLAIA